MSVISVLIPSRSRPNRAQHVLQSAKETAVGEFEILFYLNEDDPKLDEYGDVLHHAIIGPDQYAPKSWNVLAQQAKGDYLMLCGDDVSFKTKGWNKRIEKAFPEDRIAMVSFDDGRPSIGHPHPVVSREWVDTVGYFLWPEFNHWFVDIWIEDIADLIDRKIYLPDVLIDHVTFKDNKGGRYDEIYQRARTGEYRRHDEAEYQAGGARRVADAAKLRAVIEDFKQREANDA